MQSGRRQQSVNHRQGSAHFYGCGGQRTPSFGDGFVDAENPVLKPKTQIDR